MILKTVAVLVIAKTIALGAQVVHQRDASGRDVERQCQPADWPKQLPAPDSIVDYGTLLAATDALRARDNAAVLLSILYRKDGTATVRLLEPDTVSPPFRSALLSLVGEGLRPLPPPSEVGALRLRLRGRTPGTGSVERATYCPPQAGPEIGVPRRVVVALTPGDRLPTPGTRHVDVEAELSIDKSGRVTDVRMIASSGIRELDDDFVRQQFARRFLAALVDGLPIASWVRTNGSRMRL